MELVKYNIRQDNQVKPVNITDYTSEFIKFLDVSQKTTDTYIKAIRQFLKYLKDNNIKQPKRVDVIAYKDYLKATNKKNTTIQTYITVIKQFFKWTYTSGLYPNITEHLKGAKVSKQHKKDALTINQVKDVLNNFDKTTIKGLRDYTLTLLAVSGGLRCKELSNAQINDIRPLGNEMVLYILGKGRDSKDDYIKLPNELYKQILEYCKVAGISTGYIFTSLSNNKSEQLTTRSISRILKAGLKNTGYDSDRLTAHSLRHTAITLALLSGEQLQEVQAFARHSNINTTMIYNHAIDNLKNNCTNSIVKQIL